MLLSEIRQSEKSPYCMITIIEHSCKDKIMQTVKRSEVQREEGSYLGWHREPELGPGTLTASSWPSGWGTGLSHSAGSLFLNDAGPGAGEHVCDEVPSVPQSPWSPQASPGRPRAQRQRWRRGRQMERGSTLALPLLRSPGSQA